MHIAVRPASCSTRDLSSFSKRTDDDIDRLTRVEREALRAAAARALVECCDECRDLLPAQLQAEENRG